MPEPDPHALVELRVLDGPNHYFPRPAVRASIRPLALLSLPGDRVVAAAARLGLPPSVAPAPPGTEQRLFVAARMLAALTRALASAGGVRRLAVRSRPVPGEGLVVVAFPWRRLGRARALAAAVARVAEALGEDADLDELVAVEAAAVAEADPGERPAVPVPRVPTVAVTGTNGKTTVTRLVAHMAARAGHVPGWCSSDGVFVAGNLVEAGDLTGFVGSRSVLEHPDVTFAVLETARGGILRRGIGAVHNDVAVVTNVSADHLGLGGIDTLDELAEVKAAVLRITRPDGWAVLNADDPRVLAMARHTRARLFAFGLDAAAPGLRAVLDRRGRAITVVDGAIALLGASGPQPLVGVRDVPLTFAGLSAHNVANALAAAAAGIAAGLPCEAVVDALRTFTPDVEHNPGRFNGWDLDGRLVLVDYGHNEEGLRALLDVAAGLRPPGAALRLVLNGVGDRTDAMLRAMGELAGKVADDVVLSERASALRGRTPESLFGLLRDGLATVGCVDVEGYPTELAATGAVVGRAAPGDVCAVMCHGERDAVTSWLRAAGAQPLDASEVRRRATLSSPG